MTRPTALTNIALAYNGTTGTLDTKADFPEVLYGGLSNPASLVCNLLGEAPGADGLCTTLTNLLPKLPSPPALPRAAAAGSGSPDRVNNSLSDMLAVH